MRLAQGNPMVRALLMVLVFDAIIFGLAIAGMIQVSDVSPGVAALAGGGGAVLALIAAATLRRGWWWLSWLVQVVGIALGFATPMMFWVGGSFAVLWVIVFALGKRLEQVNPAA